MSRIGASSGSLFNARELKIASTALSSRLIARFIFRFAGVGITNGNEIGFRARATTPWSAVNVAEVISSTSSSTSIPKSAPHVISSAKLIIA